jgi:hypothetical protein
VEEWQDADHHVFVVHVDRLDHGLGVGHDILVGQHHALGLAGAAAGEDDRRQVLDFVRAETEQAFQQKARQQDDGQKRAQLLKFADRLAEVFQINSQVGVRQLDALRGKQA